MNNEEKILAMLEEHSKMFQQMNARMDEMRADMGQMQSDMGQMRADLGQMQSAQAQMQDDISAIKARLDYDVEKRFDAVNEGIDAILAQLTPKRKVEEMDADIVVLKTAVKMLTQEVAELKKAQ